MSNAIVISLLIISVNVIVKKLILKSSFDELTCYFQHTNHNIINYQLIQV